ncbi:MAG TPA: serine/threonine-protein kinase [Kofleriaceae bacterium]|nr:serine/threonine-protein kinase [Kofleriaceae bacterium]
MAERDRSDSELDATVASDETPAVDSPGPGPAAKPGSFGPGATIGRYLIKEVVGAGGSGLVLAALDTELGRKVAIKVLSREQEEGRIRLMREAQAMARLSHPNVVTVHEVIRVGDREGIVMELVDGVDLATWRKDTTPTWREVVAVYIQAARGLAAAHRIGLVHRDFKPSNALIDRDGVVRVTDFGLVRAASEHPITGDDDTPPPPPIEGAAWEDVSLTRTGVILGTPAYMAPEQHAGGPVDARTDQWALACSLYHALYNQRPFPGHTLSELATSVLGAKLRDEPRSSKVPRPIRAAIRRALSKEPGERYATMDQLIGALAPPRRGGVAVAAVGVAAVGAVAALSFARSDDASTRCRGLEAPFTAIWNAGRAAELEARFTSVGSDAGAATADTVVAGLDKRGKQWVEARIQTCAQGQQGVISSELLDRRVRCLDGRLVEMETIISAWLTIERDSIGGAPDVVDRMHAIADCEDPSQTIPLPTDPALRAEITRGERVLAQAWALAEVGFFDRSRPLAAEAVAIGDRAAWAPFQARALMQLSKALSHEDKGTEALALIDRAATAAARAGDDLNFAETLISRFWVVAVDLGRPDDALAGQQYIELALERAKNPPRQRAHWLHHLAAAYYYKHRYDDALAAERASQAILKELFPPGHVELRDGDNSIAVFQSARGEYDEAQRLLEATLAHDLRTRGPDHPVVASDLLNLGDIDQARGDLVAALARFERGAAILAKAGQPEWMYSLSVGFARYELGRWSTAIESLERALAGAEKTSPPPSLQVGYATTELGAALTAMGELERGREVLVRSVDVSRAAKSPALADALGALALNALARGDVEAARRAVAEGRGAEGGDAPRLLAAEAELARRDGDCGAARTKLAELESFAKKKSLELTLTDVAVARAECALAEGKARDAAAALEARIARMESLGAEPPALARARRTLARVAPKR